MFKHLLIACFTLGPTLVTAAPYVVQATSEEGRDLTLEFDTEAVSRRNKTAVLCSDPAGEVTKAVLWMPDHKHGSTPTQLHKLKEDCVRIERINFTMKGDWDIQVTFVDGDRAVLSFNVKP